MDAAAAALVGMELAAAGFAGAGVGIGYIFGKMIEAVARQPEAEGRVGKTCGSDSRWSRRSLCTGWSLRSSSWAREVAYSPASPGAGTYSRFRTLNPFGYIDYASI